MPDAEKISAAGDRPTLRSTEEEIFVRSGSWSKKRHALVSSIACLAVLSASALVAGCGSSGGSDSSDGDGGGDKGAVAMSFGGLEQEIWQEEIEVMKPIVEKAGFEFLVDDPQFNVDKQVRDWEAWIARGDVEAIMGFPVSVDALIPVTERANDAGIPVLGHGSNWEGTMAAFLTEALPDGEKLGRLAGEWMKEKYGDKPVETVVFTNRESDIARERSDGIVKGVEESAPTAVIYDTTALTREEGLTAAKAQLTAHPDIKVWLGINDTTVLSANQTLRDKGVSQTDPNYFLGSLDLVKESLEMVAIPNSMWRVGLLIPGQEAGEIEAKMLIEAGEGKTVKDVLVPATEVTSSNADQYLK